MSEAIERVLAARAAVLQQSGALGGAAVRPSTEPGGFGPILDQALGAARRSGAEAASATEAFERGQSDDIAGVMLKRQAAAIDFETALQVRNRLLGAYRDLMNMPV